MWLQYRKALIPTQLFIFALIAVLYWRAHFPPGILAIFFFVMQVGAVIGAAWATRLQRKIERQRDRLPLERLL